MPPTALLNSLEGIRRRVRVLTVLFGIGLVIAAAVSLLLATVLIDYFLNLSAIPRVLALLASIGGIGYVLAHFIVRPLLVKLQLTDIAGRLEHAFPQFEDRLRSTVNFILTGTPGSIALKDRVITEATAMAQQVDLTRAVDIRPVWASAGGAVGALMLAVLLAFAAGAQYRGIALSRLFNPFGATQWPKIMQIDLNGTLPKRVPVGQRIDVKMHLAKGGNSSTKAKMFYQYGNGTVEQEFMSRDSDGTYVGSVVALGDASRGAGLLKIWMSAGDDQKDLSPITVVDRLAIQNVEAIVTPPAYSGLPAFPIDLARAPARMTAGARLDLKVRFNKTLAANASVKLVPIIADGKMPEVQWDAATGGLAVGHLVPLASTRFHISATDEDGFTNSGLEEYELTVNPDEMPSVQIENPTRNLECPPGAQIRLQGSAQDDYGIKTMNLMVDRLGDNARHWIIPLVQNSAAANGIQWDRIDSGGEKVNFRMSELWDLAKLAGEPLKPGDVVEYYLQVQDNYDFNGAVHPPVSSGKLRLTIISQDQYTQIATDTLRNLAQQTVEVKGTQDRTKQDTVNLKADTQKKPQLDEADRAVADRVANQQTSAASQAKQIVSKIDDLLQQMNDFRSQAQDLKDVARDARNLLNAAAEKPMKDAAGQINQAKDAKVDPKASADQQAQDAAARDDALKNAVDNQQQASDQMQKALDRMGNVGGLHQAIETMAQDLKNQEALSAQTSKIGQTNLGKKPDQISTQDRAALDKIADDQKSLAAKTQKDLENLQKAGDQMAKSDPSDSEAMKKAAQTGQQQNVPANQQKASDAARQNQQGPAQDSQKRAELGLQMVLNQLREAEQRKLAELSKKLEELQKQVAELIEQQAGHNLDNLHLQGGDVFAKLDAKLAAELLIKANRAKDHEPPTPTLPQLNSLQEQTERNTRDIAKLAEGMPDGAAPAGHLNRAAEKMQRAIVYLRAAKLSDAYDPPMVEALASLEEAKKIVDAQKAKVDQQIADKQRETIRQAFIRIRDDQVKLDKDTAGLDQAPKGDDGQLAHGDAVRLARLPGLQGDLSDQANKLTADLSALNSIVYVWANKDIVKSMREVKDELAKPNTGKITQAEQARVVEQLTAMIDDLAIKPQDKKFEQPKSAGGGSGSGGGSRPLPPEAELRLLKQLQQAINNNTKLLDAEKDKDKTKLLALGGRQGELRGLLDQLLKKAAGDKSGLGPEPKDEAKLPEEADDQAIDDQELEHKLLNDKPDTDPAQHDADLVGARMSRSRHRLADDTDPGNVTQKIQDRIVMNLDQLIEMARQQQANAQGKPSQGDPQQGQKPGDQQQPKNDQANGNQPGKPNPNKGQTAAANSQLPTGPDGTADLTKPIDERLAEWGAITPRQRQAVIEGASEKIIEKYKTFVDDYYRSLATKATDRGQ